MFPIIGKSLSTLKWESGLRGATMTAQPKKRLKLESKRNSSIGIAEKLNFKMED